MNMEIVLGLFIVSLLGIFFRIRRFLRKRIWICRYSGLARHSQRDMFLGCNFEHLRNIYRDSSGGRSIVNDIQEEKKGEGG